MRSVDDIKPVFRHDSLDLPWQLALEREKLGAANKVHVTVNPTPGEPQPEREPAPSVYGPPPEVPGKEWDLGALMTFEAVASTNGLTPTVHQAVLRE